MAKKFDARKWALENVSRTGGRRCGICQHQGARDAVETIVRLIEAGESRASVSSICEPLRTEFGIDIGPTTLRYHVREHVRRGAPR